MIRTTAFAIILGIHAAPVLATDGTGAIVPRASLKDAPPVRDTYRHQTTPPEQAPVRCVYDADTYPIACEPAGKAQDAPEAAPKASGAR